MPSQLPKGILFDLDDTILVCDPLIEEAWRDVCAAFAGEAGVAPESLHSKILDVRQWFWASAARQVASRVSIEQARRDIADLALQELGVDRKSLADGIGDAYTARLSALARFYPGAEETLQRLAEMKMSMALLTNGDARVQRAKVKRFQLTRFFKTILIEGELGYGKPDEAIYRRALSDIGLTVGEVWSVGDHLDWDVAAPQKLGIYAVWNDFRGQGLPAGSMIVPDRIINSIAELLRGID